MQPRGRSAFPLILTAVAQISLLRAGFFAAERDSDAYDFFTSRIPELNSIGVSAAWQLLVFNDRQGRYLAHADNGQTNNQSTAREANTNLRKAELLSGTAIKTVIDSFQLLTTNLSHLKVAARLS